MPSPLRKKSTLAAQKYAASQRPLGEVIVAPRPQSTARKADRGWDGGPSVLIPGISAFDLPSTVKGGGGYSAAEGLDMDYPRRSGSKPVGSPKNSKSGAEKKSKSALPRAGAKPSSASRYAKASQAASQKRQDHIVVSSIVAAFALMAIGLGFFQVRGGMVTENSKKEIIGTLTAVHQQQSDFRAEHQRFATWAELEDRGVKIGPRQSVVASNATISHWFVSIRDSSTGLVCSRTGELFDESASERSTSCYTP